MRMRLVRVVLAGLAVLAGCLALSLALGSATLDLLHLDATSRVILLEVRLPRALLAGAVGACLATAGVAFQALLRNPLADPYVVGASSGAALGAALAILLGLTAVLPLAAFAGAVAAMAFIVRLARIGGTLPVDTFLLAGVVVGSFLWSLVSFLLTLAHQDMPRIVFWLMGSLADARWSQLPMILPYLALGLGGLFLASLTLNLLTLGEEAAIPLGLPAERAKLWVLLGATLLTAAAVSVSGLIGFLGLIVPHLCRGLVGPDHRLLLPAAALGGASFLMLCDTLARTLLPGQELPVGVITALLGAPFFFWLLYTRRRLA